VGQFEIRVHDYQERISRKGAKAQRRRRKEQAALNSLACFLCAFAPLREPVFFSSSFETDLLLVLDSTWVIM
jgi:hypothetical protein